MNQEGALSFKSLMNQKLGQASSLPGKGIMGSQKVADSKLPWIGASASVITCSPSGRVPPWLGLAIWSPKHKARGPQRQWVPGVVFQFQSGLFPPWDLLWASGPQHRHASTPLFTACLPLALVFYSANAYSFGCGLGGTDKTILLIQKRTIHFTWMWPNIHSILRIISPLLTCRKAGKKIYSSSPPKRQIQVHKWSERSTISLLWPPYLNCYRLL